MKLIDLKIGDRMQDRDALAQPAGGFKVVGIDIVGPYKGGPCCYVDWPERGMEPFGVVRASELEHWEFVILKGDLT
jgi:hypothetical protein